eukprot:IDg4449t1
MTQRALAGLAHMTRTRVFVDVNWRPVFWRGISDARDIVRDFIDAHATYVKMSVNDARFLLGDVRGAAALKDPRSALEALGVRCRGVLVTDGARGSAYAFRERGVDSVTAGRIDAFQVAGGAVDDTGAGDAFLAGFIAQTFHLGGFGALGDKDQLKRIVRFASAVAYHVVAQKGAVAPQPTREQVEAFLKQASSTERALTS